MYEYEYSHLTVRSTAVVINRTLTYQYLYRYSYRNYIYYYANRRRGVPHSARYVARYRTQKGGAPEGRTTNTLKKSS